MLRNRFSMLRLALLASVALALPACDTDGPGKPGYNFAGPVISKAVVTITSNRSQLPILSDSFATLTITVSDSVTGAPARDLTVVSLTTNLGSFGFLGGPSEAAVETIGGRATIAFFGGESPGTATIRAEALGGVGFVSIRIR